MEEHEYKTLVDRRERNIDLLSKAKLPKHINAIKEELSSIRQQIKQAHTQSWKTQNNQNIK